MNCPHCGKEIPVDAIAAGFGKIKTAKKSAARRANIALGRAAAAKVYTTERRAEAARKSWETRRRNAGEV